MSKVKITRIIRHSGIEYRLEKGKAIPSMPDDLKAALAEAGYIETETKKEEGGEVDGTAATKQERIHQRSKRSGSDKDKR